MEAQECVEAVEGQDQNAEFEDIVDEVEEDLDFDDDDWDEFEEDGPGFSRCSCIE